jgi:hypothetical protein
MKAADFMKERADFLCISVVPSQIHRGWDVVLRVDGTYTDQLLAEDCAMGIVQMIESIEDLPRNRHPWWAKSTKPTFGMTVDGKLYRKIKDQ